MKNTYEKSSKWILIACGVLTAGLGAVSVSPEFFLDMLFKLDYVQNYDVIIRHWSVTIFVIGLFIMLSAFYKEWRIPVAFLAILEKVYLSVVCLLALRYDYGKSFVMVIYLDTTMSLLLGYILFKEFGKKKDERV